MNSCFTAVQTFSNEESHIKILQYSTNSIYFVPDIIYIYDVPRQHTCNEDQPNVSCGQINASIKHELIVF